METTTLRDFLKTVVTTPSGNFVLMVGSNGTQREEWYSWPDQLDDIVAAALRASERESVYFSAHLFNQPKSTRKNVLPSHTIQADLDGAPLDLIDVEPNILVKTSSFRHQAFWIIRDDVPVDTLEELSRRVTYSTVGCDLSGWQLGRKVRLPYTLNYKYTPPEPVSIVDRNLTHTSVSQLRDVFLHTEALPKSVEDDAWVRGPHTYNVGPLELIESVRGKIPHRVVVNYNKRAEDRSAALWALTVSAFRAGLDRDAVYWLAFNSPNNKFADNRYDGEVDLAKDILRAEREAFKPTDLSKKFINELRKLPGLVSERRAFIAETAVKALNEKGQFLHTSSVPYYLPEKTGHAISIDRNSQIQTLLETTFGINASEQEYSYLINALQSYAWSQGRPVEEAVLSHYNTDLNAVLLHTGGKHVYSITKDMVNQIDNGSYRLLFQTPAGAEPFTLEDPLDDWSISLFEGYFDNLVELDAEQAKHLIRVFVLFMLFRNATISRPILALFGAPGSGKSTIMRVLYMLLYGPRKSLGSVTNPEDFDYACALNPFYVLDNVDTWAGWLPDRLALAASPSDIQRRKLYTDTDTITITRQALIGITAHNPKFGREDIVDRLLLLNFQRLQVFRPESELLGKVWAYRNRIWASIVKDVQKVLATEFPKDHEIPSFRINDFARYGIWISRALDNENLFRRILNDTRQIQHSFNLSEDDALVDSINRWLDSRKEHGKFYTAHELWGFLTLYAADPFTFTKVYRNAIALSKKLWVLQETLRDVYDIGFDYNVNHSRIWRIDPK